MRIVDHAKKVTRQTGPKTERGKRHSSRNALRHGLAIPPLQDEKYLNRIRQVTDAILGQDHDSDRFTPARDIAEALLEIERIRNYQLQSRYRTTGPRAALRFGGVNDADEHLCSSGYLARAYGRLRASIKRFDRGPEPNGRSLLPTGVDASGVAFDHVVEAKHDR